MCPSKRVPAIPSFHDCSSYGTVTTFACVKIKYRRSYKYMHMLSHGRGSKHGDLGEEAVEVVEWGGVGEQQGSQY
jgi:hypothetical protein